MEGGRIVREGVSLEVNAYCRRANSKAVELAGDSGEVVVFTMGPPAADDALREMIAAGAHRGIHICDPSLAGSDTLATAVALAAAVRKHGPFDLVFAGLNSLDSDTGQVPPELADLLGLPFAAGVRELEIDEGAFTARLETEDGYCTVKGKLPVVLSAAERLCRPSKAWPEMRAEVAPELITRVSADDLEIPAEQRGEAGSPTSVGPVRAFSSARRALRASSVTEAVDLLERMGAFDDTSGDAQLAASDTSPGARDGVAEQVAAGTADEALATKQEIWCFFTATGVGTELLSEASELASQISGSVTAVTNQACAERTQALAAAGADRVLVIPDANTESEYASALASAAGQRLPWGLLVEGTRSGRTIASIVAARCGWGLTGDAVGLEVDSDGRLVAWKPAFGGRMQAPILTSSPVQMATIRPGVLASRPPRDEISELEAEVLPAPERSGLQVTEVVQNDDDSGELRRARTIVAVGVGVDPDGYSQVDELREALGGAALGATRRVTDPGWVPRSRQIGVTGHAVAPQLFVAVGSSGRFNHTVGIRNAGVILAINSNPDAEIFDQVDVGIVGSWQDTLPSLTAELNARGVSERLAP